MDRSILPADSRASFLRGPVSLSDLNTWAIGVVGPQNFGVKWHAGRARPEEVAMKIKDGSIPPEYVNPELLSRLALIDFDEPTAFTAYPEGSPKHPSWPAMHSAASAGSLWIPLVMDLTPEQVCMVQAVDYAVAYARTVAGVHFPSDNIDGLNLGQEILAYEIPDVLVERFGANRQAVKDKIRTIRFDWNDYLTSDCFESMNSGGSSGTGGATTGTGSTSSNILQYIGTFFRTGN